MEQFEKVCKGFECCLIETQEHDELSCADCPYNPCGLTVCLPISLIDDVRKLITAQQERIKELEAGRTARVMTLEEVHEMAWDYCYIEEEVIKDNVLQKYCGKHRIKCITWPSIASCVLTFGDDAYGKRWRCWTQRPTDEQREKVDWDG